MDAISILFIFIFGTIVGSFLNVVILRYNTGMSSATGRSVCFNCNTRIHWYDMIPIVSYFLLLGKCRSCKSVFSLQYPLVEFFTGITFVLLAIRQYSLLPVYSEFAHAELYSMLFFLFYAVVFSLLIVICVYDFQHKIIPNELVYTFIGLSILKLLVFMYCTGFVFDRTLILHILSPFILSVPFAFLWYISQGKWIGLGDAKLMFGMGALLGFTLGVSAVVLAFWIGAVWGIGVMIYSRVSFDSQEVHLASELPFAPFLIFATMFVFFSHVDVLGLSALLTLHL